MKASEVVGDQNLWAEQGGLIGLILFSLFSLIALFLWINSRKDDKLLKVIKEKDDKHSEFLQGVLDRGQQERVQTADKLGAALDNLADTIKGNNSSKG